MADFLVYWKVYWEQEVADVNEHWQLGKKAFYDRVRPGDSLWIVVTGGEEHPQEWKLLQRIPIIGKRIDRKNISPYGKYHLYGHAKSVEMFDITKQANLEPTLKALDFESGKKIDKAGSTIGLTLQSPRPLRDSDVILLKRFLSKSDTGTVKGNQPPEQDPTEEIDEKPFQPEASNETTTRKVKLRKRLQQFEFNVFKRYGKQCMVCGLAIPELLDACHIRPKKDNGSDDARNGLVLCSLHHRAFDAGFFGIDPSTLIIAFKARGPSAEALRITKSTLSNMANKPHEQALNWRWENWKKSQYV